jgi:hypothetical protein
VFGVLVWRLSGDQASRDGAAARRAHRAVLICRKAITSLLARANEQDEQNTRIQGVQA